MLPRTSPLVWIVPALAALLAGPATGQEAGKSAAKHADPAEGLTTSSHSVTLNGKKFDYQATAGQLTLRDDDGKVTAHMFFVAYTRPAVPAEGPRPVTFAFNGGPGSSAAWLHLG